MLLGGLIHVKELVWMSFERRCSFYRYSNGLSLGRGVGYCDFDNDLTTCDGGIHFCEKPDALSKYLLDQKGGNTAWENGFQELRKCNAKEGV